MELPQNVGGKRFVYDTVVARDSGSGLKGELIIEVLHTHKTGEQKIQAVENNGMHVAEVEAETVLNLLGELRLAKQNGTRVTIRNLLTANVVCDDCKTDHKRLQKRGFEMAFQKQELLEDKKRRRYKYEKGYKKCFECQQWFPASILYALPYYLWKTEEYEDIQQWYRERYLDLPCVAFGCEECTIKCVACGQRFPLDSAERYGLCLPCNSKQNVQAKIRQLRT